MYGSYGSYSSMSSTFLSAPMDITSSNLRAHDAACAFPSWPRRSSLSESDRSSDDPPRASSYLSDDDLFPPTFEDDARSVSSAGSLVTSPMSRSPRVSEAELLEMERERQARQREAIQFLLHEKERRRQAALRNKRRANGSGSSTHGGNSSSSSSSKKPSPRSKLSAMTPIAE